MKKQNIIWSIILILIIVFVSGATIYAKKITDKDENELLKSKVKEEINYLDSKISSMLNSLNNITLRNYIVKAEEINSQTSEEEGKSTSEENSDSSSKSSETAEKGSSTSGGSDSGGEEEQQPEMNSKMEYSSIIGNERKTSWNDLKTDVENLYSSWSVIILDLYKLNIDGDKILQFSNLLDTLTLAIKEENKERTLDTLTNMYSSIVGYANDFSNQDSYKNMLTTRENIFYAYAKVDSQKWDEVKIRLQQAESAYANNLDNMNRDEKEFNLNKGYILLKELQNSTQEQDEDIFYIKYKNLMEELNLLMS